jgi:hypothetical protein
MRDKFTTRLIYLANGQVQQHLIKLIVNLPIDAENPLEIVIREKQVRRGLDANARMWVGPLKDIAEQAWVDGRQFSAEVWHDYFKKEFLPETNDPELHELVTDQENWKKWDYAPDGERVLVGTTTKLSKKGFARYVMQVEAFGANLGVMFSANPNERMAV